LSLEIRVSTLAHYSGGVSPSHANSLGACALFIVFIAASSRSIGTHTGIKAVSNGQQIVREP